MKIQNKILNNGRKVELRISELWVNGMVNKIKIAQTIATTPPSLSGIERDIA